MSTPARVSLTSSASIVSQPSYGFEFAGNYAFYDRNGDDSVKPEYYQNLLSSAKKIVIWDPHFMEEHDGQLFEYVKTNDIEIEILTVCTKDRYAQQEQQEVIKLRDNIKNALRKAGITRYGGYVYAFKHYKVRDYMGHRIYQCHDRFLMLDDKDLYLVGASMNNQLGSEWNFGIMKIDYAQDSNLFDLVNRKYNDLKNKFSANQNGWMAKIRP